MLAQECATTGFSWFLRAPLTISLEFNDVRPNGSTALESWTFMGLKTRYCNPAVPPLRQIRMLALGIPLMDGNRGTYVIPTMYESVKTWTNGSFAIPLNENGTAGAWINPLATILDAAVRFDSMSR